MDLDLNLIFVTRDDNFTFAFKNCCSLSKSFIKIISEISQIIKELENLDFISDFLKSNVTSEIEEFLFNSPIEKFVFSILRMKDLKQSYDNNSKLNITINLNSNNVTFSDFLYDINETKKIVDKIYDRKSKQCMNLRMKLYKFNHVNLTFSFNEISDINLV